MPTDTKRGVVALAAGVVAGVIPNRKSNIAPWILGAIFAVLFTKIIFGDYDRGYQWSFSDLYFITFVGGLGAIGALVVSGL